MGPEIQGQEATFEFRCWRLLTSSLSRGRKLSTGTSMTRMGLVLKPQPGLILGHLPGHLLQVAGTAGQFPGRWALTVAIPYNSLLTAHLSPLYRRAFMPGALPSLLPRGQSSPRFLFSLYCLPSRKQLPYSTALKCGPAPAASV